MSKQLSIAERRRLKGLKGAEHAAALAGIEAAYAASVEVNLAERERRDSDRLAHIRVLHPAGSEGVGALVEMRVVPDYKTGKAAPRLCHRPIREDLCEVEDDVWTATHISQHRFRLFRNRETRETWVRRSEQHLKRLQVLWADLDYYRNPALAKAEPETVKAMVFAALDGAGLPRPSMVFDSGRGIRLDWLHNPIPEAALPRWKATMRNLLGLAGPVRKGRPPAELSLLRDRQRMWKPFGRDTNACDGARYFRLAGTRNEKEGGRVVRLMWPASWDAVERHDFEALATAFNGITREAHAARLETVQVERQAKALTRRDRERATAAKADVVEATSEAAPEVFDAGSCKLTGITYWSTVWEDLNKLRKLHGGRIPEGIRHAYLLLAANAQGWICGGNKRAWAAELADHVVGMPQAEIVWSLSSLDRRVAEALTGKKRSYRGKEVDARLRFSAAKMVSWLDITADQARQANLRVLVPEEVRAEREVARHAARRVARGMIPHADAKAELVAAGLQALAWRQEKVTVAEMAKRLNRSKRYVENAMKAAVTLSENASDANAQNLHGGTVGVLGMPQANLGKASPQAPRKALTAPSRISAPEDASPASNGHVAVIQDLRTVCKAPRPVIAIDRFRPPARPQPVRRMAPPILDGWLPDFML
jgi:hypothetical protein